MGMELTTLGSGGGASKWEVRGALVLARVVWAPVEPLLLLMVSLGPQPPRSSAPTKPAGPGRSPSKTCLRGGTADLEEVREGTAR